ncbi:sigma-54-dependent transcriptional regulator [Desulfoluna butyratoxydans]|uniref:Signal transduction response regulator receiver domain n=1 Tax=Desulfoluna butyratoxydans TaxID=231438 RepID=A0A4U8YHW4_9BACT|nr:sigma-54 dependent transcriptional regulator [Desulfoluna butyratoxydans]VFQ43196.1 signal transduction response regulator receiver domain [Desulfoluna butyratoxydans]
MERLETILIVDDETDLTRGLARTLQMALPVTVRTAASGEEALVILKQESVDLILTDISMPEMSGMELLEQILADDATQTVILMTAYGTIDVAVSAMKKGAWDFLQKPFASDTLARIVTKGLERHRLLRENRELTARLAETSGSPLVGNSVPIRQTLDTLAMLGQSDVTVLIRGETGTGKDLAARIIHEASARKAKPFVTVNCPALPEGLLESELFGHKKGAFTNADTDKVGLFDQARGGTLFLDEIGDLTPGLQTKLLRVLQNREIRPLGDTESHTVDVRILAATNQALESKIDDTSFRADLFYRLNVATVTMPPLRDIRDDIPLLVEHFLSKASRDLKLPRKQLSPVLMASVCNRPWPGNTRELENTLTGWVALTQGDTIDLCEVPDTPPHGAPPTDSFAVPYLDQKEKIIESFTRDYLHRLFTETGGNVALSARKSGIKRQSLQKIIQRYAIDVESYRK